MGPPHTPDRLPTYITSQYNRCRMGRKFVTTDEWQLIARRVQVFKVRCGWLLEQHDPCSERWRRSQQCTERRLAQAQEISRRAFMLVD